MRVYLANPKSPSRFVEICKEEETVTSCISNSDIDVRVGKSGSVFFSERDYGVEGFSLSFEELGVLMDEARRKKVALNHANASNKKVGYDDDFEIRAGC